MNMAKVSEELQIELRNNSNHLPFPLAMATENITYYCDQFLKTSFSSKFLLLKSLLDYVEIYAKFVSVIYLSECRSICSSSEHKELFSEIKKVLIDNKRGKGRITYSMGDWLAIAETSAKTLCRYSSSMVFPELLKLVVADPDSSRISRVDAFATARDKIVGIRNRRTGHGYINDSDDPEMDVDFNLTLSCVTALVSIANKIFTDFSFVIAFYLNNQDSVYSWFAHGLEITERFEKGGPDSCDKLIKLQKGDRQLVMAPFVYYTTGALNFEYYYLMDFISEKNKSIDDIGYLGIGRLKSNHSRLTAFAQPQLMLKLFSEFLGMGQQQPTTRTVSFAEILRADLEARISRTVDRLEVRRSLKYLLEKNKRLFVEASPGAGKTILASWWASQDDCMVFFNNYGSTSDPLAQMYRWYYLQLCHQMGMIAEDTYDPARLKDLFNAVQHKYMAEKQSLVLLFDGFDELPDESYSAFSAFMQGLHASVKLVIFSRPVPRDILSSAVFVTTLPPMTINEVEHIPAISDLGLNSDLIKRVFEFSGGNPLIAIFAAREASANSSFLGQSLKDFYLNFFKDLMSLYDKEMICTIFAALIYSARSLRYEELHELFSKYSHVSDLSKMSEAFRKISRFISVGHDGGCSLFHKSFADAILPEIPAAIARSVNYALAGLFERTASDSDKRLVPHHLLLSEQPSAFIAKSTCLPKQFIDYFIAHAQIGQRLIAPKYTNKHLDEIFGEMQVSEAPGIKLIVAQVLYYFGFWRNAEAAYEFVYNSGSLTLSAPDRLRLSVTLGALYKNLDKWEKARGVLEASIRHITSSPSVEVNPAFLLMKKDDLGILCRLYNNLASILYDSGTSRRESVRMFDFCRIMAEKCSDELCVMAADIGNLCYLIENSSYDEAGKLIDNLKPLFKKYPVEELYLRFNQTAYCLRSGYLKGMQECFDVQVDDAKAVKTFLYGFQNRQLTAYFFNNLAVYYQLSGNSTAAVSFIDVSVNICREIEDYCMLSGALINSAIMTGELKKLEESEAIAARIGDEEEVAYCRHNRDVIRGASEHQKWLETFYVEIDDPSGREMIGKARPWIMTQFVDLFL